MKVWTILLSVYITLLAAMPCCAFDNCPDDKNAMDQTAQNSHQQGDEDGCGTCSPFFNCSACGASFVAPVHLSFEFIPACSITPFRSHYASAILKNSTGKIWQPPKTA